MWSQVSYLQIMGKCLSINSGFCGLMKSVGFVENKSKVLSDKILWKVTFFWGVKFLFKFHFSIISIFRCTLNAIPQNEELLQKARLPFGLTLHPFRDCKVFQHIWTLRQIISLFLSISHTFLCFTTSSIEVQIHSLIMFLQIPKKMSFKIPPYCSNWTWFVRIR